VEGSSTIVMDRPFPNDPTLFSSWASFFAQAQAASGTAFVWADPELNVEPTADKQTVCTVLPFTIDLIDIAGFGPNSSKYSQTALNKFSCAKPLALFNF
jgi:hypothetical protein